jgi:aquaporin Z
VTLAFWRRGKVHPHDLGGYVAAQVCGAFAGAGLVRWLWGARATAVDLGVTQPGNGIGGAGAAAIEALMTSLLVGGILLMVSSARTAPWTPLMNWVLVAFLVWQGAPWTGTSLNPARSLAPAAIQDHLAFLWAYVIGPLAGGLLAAGALSRLTSVETVTAKLFHDSRYRSTLGSTMPVRAPA